MKKLILSLVLLSILITPFGTVAAAEGQQASPETTAYTAGNVPAETDVRTAMYPPIHAMVLTMVENDLEYDADDQVFLWTSLYYMLSLYGEMDDRATLTDDTLLLPLETVMDYASALFPASVSLTALPGELADRMTYRAADDMYLLARGDAGLAAIELGNYRATGFDSYRIDGNFVHPETGTPLFQFQVDLKAQDTMFGYVITDLTIV